VATDPAPDLMLQPINGESRSLAQLLTTFHLAFVALDPFTNESAWILETAGRVLTQFDQADVRVAWLVTGNRAQCRQFLGPWAERVLTFADPDRAAIKGLGLTRLPAFVHLGMDGTIVGAAEGWDPPRWRAIADHLAVITAWIAPVLPLPGDPGAFQGTPAAG
jgi:hypothetical protein